MIWGGWEARRRVNGTPSNLASRMQDGFVPMLPFGLGVENSHRATDYIFSHPGAERSILPGDLACRTSLSLSLNCLRHDGWAAATPITDGSATAVSGRTLFVGAESFQPIQKIFVEKPIFGSRL